MVLHAKNSGADISITEHTEGKKVKNPRITQGKLKNKTKFGDENLVWAPHFTLLSPKNPSEYVDYDLLRALQSKD